MSDFVKFTKSPSAAILMGNALEYYDTMLFGFFATTIGRLFFPEESHFTLIFSLFVFAAGFIMRPFGGFVFGHIGDKLGRKKALLISITVISLPTFIIGLLPSYTFLGSMAPLLLIICRLLQGLCVGGEYSGAAVAIIENAQDKNTGLMGGILLSSSIFGGLIGTFLGFIFTLNYMPEWGWRIPFLLGGIFGCLGYFLRKKLHETHVFNLAKKTYSLNRFPLLEAIKTKPINILYTFGIGAMTLTPVYLTSIHMNTLLKDKINLTHNQIMLLSVFLMFYHLLSLPVLGWIADKIGHRRQMQYSSLLFVLCAPIIFYGFDSGLTLKKICFAQVILGLIGMSYSSPSAAFMVNLFPPQQRYTGIGVGYTLGGALVGGMIPLLSTSVVSLSGNYSLVGLLLAAIGLLGFCSVTFPYLKKYSGYIFFKATPHNNMSSSRVP